MKRVSLKAAGLAAVLSLSALMGTANADWSEDFSGPLTNWDEFQFDPFEAYGADAISMGTSDGKLVFDAHLPFPGPLGANNHAAGYSAVILNDPAFPDVEDVEIKCVVELDGDTSQLYGGIVARAQDVEMVPGQFLVGGQAYIYMISGYKNAEIGIHKLQNHDHTIVEYEALDASFDSRVDNEPVYLKMKITTNDQGYPRIETMASFNANFSDPFGVYDIVDTDPGYIAGPGKVGLIGFNDVAPSPEAPPCSCLLDDFEVFTESLYGGDANGDGFVNSADLDIVRSNWGTSVGVGNASMGDLSGDGMVNSSDLDLVRGNWGNIYTAATVPEPNFFVLVTFGLFSVICGLRKKSA